MELTFYFSSIHTSSIERSYLLEEKEEETSELDTYQPVQSLNNDHGVSFFPISALHNNINHHTLQVYYMYYMHPRDKYYKNCHYLTEYVMAQPNKLLTEFSPIIIV